MTIGLIVFDKESVSVIFPPSNCILLMTESLGDSVDFLLWNRRLKFARLFFWNTGHTGMEE